MMLASNFNFWAAAGLVYALAGAALFCNASFANPMPFPCPEGSPASANRYTLRRLGAQWLDTRVGATLLVIGFFLQLTGAVGTTTLNKPAVFVLLGLALFAGYYALSKDLLVDELLSSSAATASDQRILAGTIDKMPVAPAPSTETEPTVYEFRQDETAA